MFLFSTFSTLKNNLLNAWETRCNLDALLLNYNLPSEIRDNLRDLAQIALTFFGELEIPNCNRTGTTSKLNLVRFNF